MSQEPDLSKHGRYRWVIPVLDPCQCTEVHIGPLNIMAPCRPFNVTYYDTFFQSSDPREIRRLLNCSGMGFFFNFATKYKQMQTFEFPT